MKMKLVAPEAVRAQFKDWCMPRRGSANPECQTNDVWTWLIETGATPYRAHRAAGVGDKMSPMWCSGRFGQTETHLSDGSIVSVGGEHEDHYDPDFYIYNDVIVRHPDGSTEIYGYPRDVFPPTDFHTATLVDDTIWIVGGLRYLDDRIHGTTTICRLDLHDFSIHREEIAGTPPRWLFEHKARLGDGGQSIVLNGGQVAHQSAQRYVENLTTWKLDLRAKTWTALETKAFTRWMLMREDGSPNDLWAISEVARANGSSRPSTFAERYRSEFAARGLIVDAALYDARYQLPVPHEIVEQPEDSFRRYRIAVDDVIVRFDEDYFDITVTVEGTLPEDMLDRIRRHGVETFSRLEGVPYKWIPL